MLMNRLDFFELIYTWSNDIQVIFYLFVKDKEVDVVEELYDLDAIGNNNFSANKIIELVWIVLGLKFQKIKWWINKKKLFFVV